MVVEFLALSEFSRKIRVNNAFGFLLPHVCGKFFAQPLPAAD
jgi:hypothetical protein